MVAEAGPAALIETRAEIERIAAGFAAQRAERQQRRFLDPADFAAIRDTGFLLSVVPRENGGTWTSVPASTRAICEMLRILAHGDASVALVTSMHPTVVVTCRWPLADDPPREHAAAWRSQREEIFAGIRQGAWWGTITSEPGSGGDFAKTKTIAGRGEDGRYRVSGAKHFGSGSGMSSFMITTAVPEGEAGPELFALGMRGVLDARGIPVAGAAGVTLVAPWDGAGMTATQSHGMRFEGFPAARVGWPGMFAQMLKEPANGFVPAAFTAVIVGVVEAAMHAAREQLRAKSGAMRAYERVEWTRAVTEAWLIAQAYEGMLRGVESGRGSDAVQGKPAIADLAESVLLRLTRVIGGGAFSRGAPFAHWFEDVRALGFLRPPWSLVYDGLFDLSWS